MRAVYVTFNVSITVKKKKDNANSSHCELGPAACVLKTHHSNPRVPIPPLPKYFFGRLNFKAGGVHLSYGLYCEAQKGMAFAVLVINRERFLHFCLEFGFCLEEDTYSSLLIRD